MHSHEIPDSDLAARHKVYPMLSDARRLQLAAATHKKHQIHTQT